MKKEYKKMLKEMTTSKYKDVLQYIIENGSITSFEAFTKLGHTRLSASIHTLRTHYGINIGTRMVHEKDGTRYGIYTLEDYKNEI